MDLKNQLFNVFSHCESLGCLESTESKDFGVEDLDSKSPVKFVSSDSESAQFLVKNSEAKLIYRLKIDKCLIDNNNTHKCPKFQKKDKEKGGQCDFAVFNDDEIAFVELKELADLPEQSTEQCKKAKIRNTKTAYRQLCSTLKLFKENKIDLQRYTQSYTLYVVVSVLHNRVIRPLAKPKSQVAKEYFDKTYSAKLRTGNSYSFA